MSIKARLVIMISVLVTAAFVLTGVVAVRATRAGMIDRVDDTLFAIQSKSGPNGRDDKGGSKSPASPSNLDSVSDTQDNGGGGDFYKRGTAAFTIEPNGNFTNVVPSGYPDDPDPLPDLSSYDRGELASRVGEVFTSAAVNNGPEYRVLLQSGSQGRINAVAAPLGDVETTIRNLTLILGILGVIVLLVITGLVWLVIQRSLAPIDSMITTAGLIASGDLSQRVDVEDEHNEVGSLGRALNAMLIRIEASFTAKEASERRLRQFVADASHELRTPLTSIRGYSELCRSGAISTPEETRRVMQRIESESTRMGHLVEDLLLLARLDQGRPLRHEMVDLVELVDNAVMDARAGAPEQPIGYDYDQEAFVIGDADRLKQVVENLLANARIHTPSSTPVHVEVRALPESVEITVSDEGPGISPEDAERIFDRFYRADSSRARSSGGVGLGLSIASSIVAAHGGEIRLNTNAGEGAVFTVSLARAQKGAPVLGDGAASRASASTRAN